MSKFALLIDNLAKTVVGLLFGVLLVVGAAQVIARYLFNAPLDWSEELLKFAHIWLVFMAIPIAYDRGSHICVDMVLLHTPKIWQSLFAVVVDLLWLGFAILFIYYTWVIMGVSSRQTSPALLIPMSYVYFGVVLGTAYLFFCAIRRLYRTFFTGITGQEGQS